METNWEVAGLSGPLRNQIGWACQGSKNPALAPAAGTDPEAGGTGVKAAPSPSAGDPASIIAALAPRTQNLSFTVRPPESPPRNVACLIRDPSCIRDEP